MATKKQTCTEGSTEDRQARIVQNCSFVGTQYDAKTVQAISDIATGLIENAKALGKLAEVLKASNTHIDAMLRM